MASPRSQQSKHLEAETRTQLSEGVRRWEPRKVRPLAVEEVEVGDALPRRDGVVRDLLSCGPSDGRGPIVVAGSRWDGRVLVTTQGGKPYKVAPKQDLLFAETWNARRINNISPDHQLERTNIIPRRLGDRKTGSGVYVFEKWDTGEIVAEQTSTSDVQEDICGDQLSQSVWQGSEDEDDFDSLECTVNLLSLNDNYTASQNATPFEPHTAGNHFYPYDSNETTFLCVILSRKYSPSGPNPGHLKVFWIRDRKEMASLSLRNTNTIDYIRITRLNILLTFEKKGGCWVLDLNLKFLYNIPALAYTSIDGGWFAIPGGSTFDKVIFDPKPEPNAA
ncbi:hypothetical protein HDV00_004946 [Rhizophlyctis rosea]|nr:hypothetical protein HDV00_004946 [Rhizophlyctis rosea]